MVSRLGSTVRVTTTIAALGAALLLLGSLASAIPLQAQAPGGAPITLTFGPGRDGVQPGTITFAATGATQTTVTIDMAPAAAGVEQPAHVHEGGCPGVGAVKYPLTNVVNGKSVTTLNVARNALFDGTYSANVHRGPGADSQIYTACVNLAQRQTGAAATVGLPATGVGPGPARPVDLAGVAVASPSVASLSSSLTLSGAGFTPAAALSLTFYDGLGQAYAYQAGGQPAVLTASDDGTISVDVLLAENVSPAAAPGLWTAVLQEPETGITRTAEFQVLP